MEFIELSKIVEEMQKEKGEECLICHFPITCNQDLLKLDCNHCYHKKCLEYKTSHILCPYCNKLTLKPKQKLSIKPKLKPKQNICNVILKTGKNKGKKCGRLNCKIHNNNNKTQLYKCFANISSGKNKGKICNRINCKYHSLEFQSIVHFNNIVV